jgi:hypothetical protein
MKRPVRIECDIAYVTLTKGYEAIIDSEDVHLVDKFNWSLLTCRKNFYAHRREVKDGKSVYIAMHRVILNAPNGYEVDHIDGNGLNNLKSNLRLATSSQNKHNQRVSKANKSGIKGVVFCVHHNRWLARIGINGKNKHLGYFDSKELAAKAREKASYELHGEFARI